MAEPAAMRAGDEVGLGQARPQPLAAHFEQAEMADGAYLDARPVVLERVFEAPLDHRVVLFRLHIDEVDHDQSGEVAQAKLPRGLLGGFEVGLERRLLDVALPSGAAGVHVDRNQCFGLVDHQIAAGLELHGGRKHRIELRLDAHAAEQRLPAIISRAPLDHLAGMCRHQHAHEVVRGLPAIDAVDQHFIDIAGVAIPDCALDEARLLIDQRRGHGTHGVLADVVPQAHQVFTVALDLGLRPRRTGGAHDQAHALRDLELGRDFLEAAAVGGRGDFARDAAAPGRVRHQHAEAASERDIGGQRRALAPALFLDDLDQQDLAPANDFLDAVVPQHPRRTARSRLFGAIALEHVALTAKHFRRRQVIGRNVEFGIVAGGLVGSGLLLLGGGFGGLGLARVRLGVRGSVGVEGAVGHFVVGDGERHLALHRHCRRRYIGNVRFGLDGVDRRRGAGGDNLSGGTILGFLLGAGLLGLHGDQPLPVGDRDLVIVGMDFAKGEETVAAAAILDESRLEGGLHPHHFGEIDVALQLPLGRRLDVVVFEAVTVQHHNAGFFRVGGIQQHALGHSALNSGGPRAQMPLLRRARGAIVMTEGADPVAEVAGRKPKQSTSARPPSSQPFGTQRSWHHRSRRGMAAWRSSDPVSAVGGTPVSGAPPRWKYMPAVRTTPAATRRCRVCVALAKRRSPQACRR